MPPRPIAQVIAEQAPALLAIYGVVGVYEGALGDGTPCIHVAVRRLTPEVEEGIPATIEGYPVLLIETGSIEPHRPT